MNQYILPDLPYDYGALEPHISGRIMELHHDKHHRNYVRSANEATEGLAEARCQKNAHRIGRLAQALAFNLSGHILHSIFWRNLSKNGGGAPKGLFADAIGRDFGSFEDFKSQFTQTASGIMGSGWAALVWDSVGKNLSIMPIHDHQSQTTQGAAPIMVLDVWEHAYYLQYQTEKTRYFEAVWNIWNWEDIGTRFEHVQTLDLRWTKPSERRTHPERLHAGV